MKPRAGTTAFVKYDLNIPSEKFCEKLLKETGVMFVPGKAMDMEGFIRIGYANTPKVIEDGLKQVSLFLKKLEE